MRVSSQGLDGQSFGRSNKDGGIPLASYAFFKAEDDKVAADMVALARHIFALANAVFRYKRAVPSALSFTLEASCSDILSEQMEAAFGAKSRC